MADITITSPIVTRPWYTPRRVLGNIWGLRQYPVIPVFILMIVLVIPAIFAELIAPYDPVANSLRDRLLPPFWMDGGSLDHVLGTDKVGRDILSRLIYGSRVSVVIASISIVVGGLIGTSLGIIGGYFGGWVDSLITVSYTHLTLPTNREV